MLSVTPKCIRAWIFQLVIAVPGLLASAGAGAAIFSSALPTSRAVQVGQTASFYATMVTDSAVALSNCRVELATAIDAVFSYQTTDPLTNAPTGQPDTPTMLAPGGSQSFVLTLTPNSPIPSAQLAFNFVCDNENPAAVVPGLNTLQFSADANPVPDIIALAATVNGDGIVDIPVDGGLGFFTVATNNIGATGTLDVTGEVGPNSVSVDQILVCQTDAGGACISPPVGAEISTQIDAGATPTFAVFAASAAVIPFDPGNNRLFLTFSQAGQVRGSTSVAMRGGGLSSGPSNQPPNANAGPDQNVNEGVLVNLTGAATDPDGSINSVAWQQIAGTNVALANPAVAATSFMAPAVDGNPVVLTFRFTATDNNGVRKSDTVSVTVNDTNPPNQPPQATPGGVTTDQSMPVDIVLAGTDTDGTVASFTVQAQPTDGTLTGAAPNLTYTPDAGFDGEDSFTFTVADDDGAVSAPATITITVNPVTTARAGSNQVVDTGATVNLDGSASTPGAGSNLSFNWTQIGGEAVTLSDSTTEMPSFTAPDTSALNGIELTFNLLVTNDNGESSQDQVLVTVLGATTATSFTMSSSLDSKAVSPDGRLSIFAPAGAFAQDTVITITRIADVSGFIYQFSPSDIDLNEAVSFFWNVPDTTDSDSTLHHLLRVDDSDEPSVLDTQENVPSANVASATSMTLPKQLVPVPAFVAVKISGDDNSAELGGPNLKLTVGSTKTFALEFEKAGDVESALEASATAVAAGSGTQTVLSTSLGEAIAEFQNISVTCNAVGEDSIVTTFEYTDFAKSPRFGFQLPVTSGVAHHVTTVECLPTAQQVAKELVAGAFAEATRFAPSGQFNIPGLPGSPTLLIPPRSGLVVSESDIIRYDAQGNVLDSVAASPSSTPFGGLALTPSASNSNDVMPWFIAATSANVEVFPFQGFGFNLPSFGGAFTSNIKHHRNSNGQRLANQAFYVQNNSLFSLEQVAANGSFRSSPNEVFPAVELGNDIGNSGDGLFACDPLSPAQAVCATEAGRVVFVDLFIQQATLIASNAGAGIRDVMCARAGADSAFLCGVQSFNDALLTICGGNSASSFSCDSPISVGDGVSLGAATTREGNALFGGVSYSDGDLHFIEVEPGTRNVVRNITVPNATINGLLDGSVLTNPGHIEIDPFTNKVIVTGNTSQNLILLPLAQLADTVPDPANAEAMRGWFSSQPCTLTCP